VYRDLFPGGGASKGKREGEDEDNLAIVGKVESSLPRDRPHVPSRPSIVSLISGV
jgi:hypothetical protein